MNEIHIEHSETHFIGRNGYFKQRGVSVRSTVGNTVLIEPITSRGTVGRCMIEIPKDTVPELIKALKDSIGENDATHPKLGSGVFCFFKSKGA